MTGRELKALIFRYLESRGWKNLKPSEYYGWDSPMTVNQNGEPVKLPPKHYCWHAAVAIQIAIDEELPSKDVPAIGFEVIVGGRK